VGREVERWRSKRVSLVRERKCKKKKEKVKERRRKHAQKRLGRRYGRAVWHGAPVPNHWPRKQTVLHAAHDVPH